MKKLLIAALLFFPVLFGGKSCAQEKIPRNGWLGVSIRDVPPNVAKKMKLSKVEGALVMTVLEESPAENAGVKENDVIVSYNGNSIAGADALIDAVENTSPGNNAKIEVVRNGEKKTIEVAIGKHPSWRRHHPLAVVPPIPPIPRIRIANEVNTSGLSLLDLNRQLGEYFGAPNGRGVLVEEVEKDSKAEKAGFKAGDVIINVGKETVEDMSDVQHALRHLDEGDTTDCTILRRGSRQTLSLEIEDQAPGRHLNLRFRSHFAPQSFDFESFDTDQEENLDEDLPHFETNGLRRSLEEFRHEMKGLGTRIQEEMKHLREKLGREFHHVAS